MAGRDIEGYEIHMGKTEPDCQVLARNGNAYGSYIHGFFDCGDIAFRVAETLADRKGIILKKKRMDYRAFKESQYDKLAETVRQYLDMDAVYGMLKEAKDAWR